MAARTSDTSGKEEASSADSSESEKLCIHPQGGSSSRAEQATATNRNTSNTGSGEDLSFLASPTDDL